jgi:S1-C subfamily serine protease
MNDCPRQNPAYRPTFLYFTPSPIPRKKMNVSHRLIGFVLICSPYLNGYANTTNLDHLLPNERNTIEVFRNASPNVVNVQRIATVVEHSKKQEVSDGTGSGIIWDKAGHIVTNYHVIHDADKLAVTLGKMTIPAKVIGAEPRKDIAVLAIDPAKVPAVLKAFKPFELAATHELLVGQKAIAIGNPFGLDHTLTIGVISALDRSFPGIGGVNIHDVIQTDAAINPGNSGGPLLDSQGHLIGLNTAIYSPSGSSAGIGFTVPSDEINRVVTQIIQHGRVVLAGIGIQREETAVAKRLGVKRGVLIAKVIPNTPASVVGLRGTQHPRFGHVQLGDVIVSVNDHPTRNYDAFYNVINHIGVGESINVAVLRNGKQVAYKMKTIDIAVY